MVPLLVVGFLAAASARVGVIGADVAEPLALPPNTTLAPQKTLLRARAELDQRGVRCDDAVSCASAVGAWARLDRVVLVDRETGKLRARLVDVDHAAVLFAVTADVDDGTPRSLQRACEAALWRDASRVNATPATTTNPTTTNPTTTNPTTTNPTTTPPTATTNPTNPTPPTATNPPANPEAAPTGSLLWAAGVASVGGGLALATVAGISAVLLWPDDAAYLDGDFSAADYNTRQSYAVGATVVAGIGAAVVVAGVAAAGAALADDPAP